MKRQQFFSSRSIAFCLAMATGCLLAADLFAQSSSVSVVRVEEDWELYVGEPDANSIGPQVSVTISPFSHLNGWHAVFELNHQSLPKFVAGGLQLQIWNGETPSESRKFPSANLFATPEEVVKWTQTMTVNGALLTFEVENGSSTTWGSFGGQGYLRHSTPAAVKNLNDYSPEVSVSNSGAGYAGNRVKLLVLRSVRYELSNGQIVEDTTVRVAHPTE